MSQIQEFTKGYAITWYSTRNHLRKAKDELNKFLSDAQDLLDAHEGIVLTDRTDELLLEAMQGAMKEARLKINRIENLIDEL
jgi:hypothetical protein